MTEAARILMNLEEHANLFHLALLDKEHPAELKAALFVERIRELRALECGLTPGLVEEIWQGIPSLRGFDVFAGTVAIALGSIVRRDVMLLRAAVA